MSTTDNTITISISDYERLLQIERDINNPAKWQRVAAPIFESPHPSADGTLKFLQPVTYLQGPITREVVCRNCGCDIWLVDDTNDPMCGACGIYAESGLKIIDVQPRTVEAPQTFEHCSVCGSSAWMIAADGKYECTVCKTRRENPTSQYFHTSEPK